MSKASPARPRGNNHDVSTGRVTSADEAQTTTERPAGLPNESTALAWDDKIKGEPGSAHNLKRQTQDNPANLETVEPGATPSRKSTRGSSSHLKSGNGQSTTAHVQNNTPSARAQRSQAKR